MMNILVNLPPGFFTALALEHAWTRLDKLGAVKKTSHNTAEEIRSDLADSDAVMMWSWPPLTADLLRDAPRLRFAGHLDIGQTGAQAEMAHGLPVSVSRNGFSPAVAEMALALILNDLRRVSDYHAAMQVGTEVWVAKFPDDIDSRERELTGRSVGLIGFGQVGRRLAELLGPFHVDLRVVDPYASAKSAEALGGRIVPLDEALTASDVVVLCAASNAGTAHLLGAQEIDLLRPDAVFVNVARAALVDTKALAVRLERGDLTALIDVFDREPLENESPLRTLPGAYLTPHRAGGVTASVERIVHRLIDDLEAFESGQPQQYALTAAMLPGLDA